MNFQQAVKAMQDGKKVRRPQWCRDYYLYLSEGSYHVRDSENKEAEFNIIEFQADDWEIVESDTNELLTKIQEKINDNFDNLIVPNRIRLHPSDIQKLSDYLLKHDPRGLGCDIITLLGMIVEEDSGLYPDCALVYRYEEVEQNKEITKALDKINEELIKIREEMKNGRK